VIPFFDMRAELAPIRAEIDAAIARVLDSGVFVGGAEVDAFEAALAHTLGVSHVVGVSSGTDALLATLMALGIGRGDKVLTTPLTFFATAGAIVRLGAEVVFADIDPETLTLDLHDAPAARAIIPVHLFGYPAALPQTSVPIVEDAAQSIGGAPLRGIAAAISFFPTKNLGALGDAGAIATNDAALAAKLKLLRSHGAHPKYHHALVGGNFRLDAIQAAVLRAKLPHLPAWTAARRANAARYRELLADLPIRFQPDHPQHVYHQLVIRVARRDELRAALAAGGIATEIYYPEPLHTQPALGGAHGEFPHAEAACRELLALPIHPAAPVDTVAAAIARFYTRSTILP
jgi:dTDP-4-amino-4,6-dideoxygalactose transaminase